MNDIIKGKVVDYMKKIVLVRHGESIWNLENKFTGWTDVDLSDNGVVEATLAGKILKDEGYTFDIAFTSVLKRAKHTLDIILKEMNLDIEKYFDWHLNERHYGALQGLNKKETAIKYGDEQVKLWRRSYSTRPPALTKDDERYPGNDIKYQNLDDFELPLCESLEDTYKRVIPYWNSKIIPLIKNNKKVLVVAHGNSLRSIVKYLDNLSDEEIIATEIPTGNPLVYEFDDELNVIKHYYLK